MAPKSKRKPRSREQQLHEMRAALSTLVVLAEAAAELHVAAGSAACAIADVLDAMAAIEEAKPRR